MSWPWPQEVDVCDSGQSATSTSGYLVVFGSKSLGWKIHPTPIQSRLQALLKHHLHEIRKDFVNGISKSNAGKNGNSVTTIKAIRS